MQSGYIYALEHGYDWMWVFDADCAPAPDALEKVLQLYAGWPRNQQEQTAFIACEHVEHGVRLISRVFRGGRLAPATPAPEDRYYRCHVSIWSGTLYRLAAVRQVGVPNPDYFADWGEAEYGYRFMKAGYQGYTFRDAAMNFQARGYATLRPVEVKRGEVTSTILEYPPLRCYYAARNGFYLTLYDFAELRPWMILRLLVGQAKMMVKLLLSPGRHGRQMRACFRGIWHGITGNIAARY